MSCASRTRAWGADRADEGLANLEPGAVWVPTVAEANAAAAKWRAQQEAERERRMPRRRGVAVGI